MKVIKPGSTYLYPVPAVLVSCGIEHPNIVTLAWVGTLCSDPPAVGIGIRPGRYSHELIARQGQFVVNLPRADQVSIVDYCGSVSGRLVDKWQVCRLTPAPASKVEVPLIAECPVALECRVTHQLSLGSHDLFIGQVLAVQADEELLTDRGAVDLVRANLLAYADGFYRKLGEQLGRHGDWRKGP